MFLLIEWNLAEGRRSWRIFCLLRKVFEVEGGSELAIIHGVCRVIEPETIPLLDVVVDVKFLNVEVLQFHELCLEVAGRVSGPIGKSNLVNFDFLVY